MAVDLATSPERMVPSEQPQPPIAPSHSRATSDVVSESSSSAGISYAPDTPDHGHHSNSSPNPQRDGEIQSLASLRSEEYRQLFRLPAEEVLIEDFNCACQENILVQGHMYLFLHYICFYSNIFGFETKKTIPLREVTGVKRAKTAGIFPNAIEIIAGEKKHFFASFLSRDEAFKLINEGWLQHGNGANAITEQQETTSESISHNNGILGIEEVKNFECTIDELASADRDNDVPSVQDPEFVPIVEDDIVSTTLSELQDNVQLDARPAVNVDSLSSGKIWTWKEENFDAPKIPEDYTMVAASEFPINVKDFFSLFFSEDANNFIESFHRRCGDKDFTCTSWYPHDQFGHARNVEFQHPIKIYFGAKFGSCKEVQKFRVYRNSCLVIETSQEINDVPYGDYFRVEGLWHLERMSDESKECCNLRVYVNVAFSKKTMFKGKIVQSTMEECREAYGTWISMAHELLKQNKLEKQEVDDGAGTCMIENVEDHFEREAKTEESLERSRESSDHLRAQMSDTMDVNQVGNHMQGSLIDANSIASVLRESLMKFWSSLKTQSHLPPLLVITFAVIILMQLSIVMLLARPQKVYVSPIDYVDGLGSGVAERSTEAIIRLEKRVHRLKDDMLTVEAELERMRHEHALLKAQLKDLGHLRMHR